MPILKASARLTPTPTYKPPGPMLGGTYPTMRVTPSSGEATS
jgi:hypothetical protein